MKSKTIGKLTQAASVSVRTICALSPNIGKRQPPNMQYVMNHHNNIFVIIIIIIIIIISKFTHPKAFNTSTFSLLIFSGSMMMHLYPLTAATNAIMPMLPLVGRWLDQCLPLLDPASRCNP